MVNNKNSNVLTVVFIGTKGPEDLFKNVKTKRVYVRMTSNSKDLVFWRTVSKWSGGYEADCSIKAGITMRVVDKNNKIIFEETLKEDDWNGGTSAKKSGKFFSEYLKEAEQKWAEDLHLHSYEEWKQYMCADMAAHGYKWYVDNWLYAEAKCNNKEVLGSIDILGNTHQIIKEDFTHKISGKEWSCVSIAEDEAICGFIFTKEDK